MVIKSVPIDDMNCVVFAIRGLSSSSSQQQASYGFAKLCSGSQTFMDWAVNLNSAPVAPTGFLVGFHPLM